MTASSHPLDQLWMRRCSGSDHEERRLGPGPIEDVQQPGRAAAVRAAVEGEGYRRHGVEIPSAQPLTRDVLGSEPGFMAIAILDIDGTLVDTNYQHALAWFRALRG